MKFELRPRNQLITDDELLDDLRRAAALSGSNTLMKASYEQHGRYSRGTVRTRFGSWEAALERAGLVPQRPVGRDELIADLRRVASGLGRNFISFKEYRRLGRWSERPFVRMFGDWRTALATAGLQRHPNLKDRVSNVDLFENLETVWVTLGRQPWYSEMERPLSRFSATTYAKRFGGWIRALEEFVSWINSEQDDQEPGGDEATASSVPAAIVTESQATDKIRARRTSRATNLRLRFLVMQRDNFTCRYCGRSPALTPGLVLHVDHVTPWEKGGETEIGNLQTLCEPCNLGKSNVTPTP